MRSVPVPRVLLAGSPPGEEARSRLETAGWSVLPAGLDGIDLAEVGRCHLVVLEVQAATAETAAALCRRWRVELGEQHVPVLWLADDLRPEQQAAGLEAGADACLSGPLVPELLVAQARALLRGQQLTARLLSRAGEVQQVNQRLQQAYQQIESDLELTRRIHRGFLPRVLPEVLQARFAVCYRPRSRIGGDFYDVMRLDEEHVAMYVADAMGRGLPASSLLSIYVKKSIHAKEIMGRSYRLVPPDEVLARLNRELVALNLPEPPFVTMAWVQLNCRTGAVQFARAAHPHPLCIPREGESVYWHAPGTLLGVFEAEFPAQHLQMHSGDKVLIYTDGVHPPGSGGPGGPNDLLANAARRHRALPVQPFVDQVARELLEHSRAQADFTLLAMEYQ